MIDRNKHSILVADDDPAMRYAIARGLRASGYKTVEAAAGAEALELSEFVSAVVLDVHLPDLHGLEVCRLLRANATTAHLPVIHVSAVYTSETDRDAGLRTGADAYLLAPVDPVTLAERLDALLAQRGRATP